jgi:amino acid transporter
MSSVASDVVPGSVASAVTPTDTRTLVRRLGWFDGFMLSLTVPAGVMASLGYSITSLGTWGAAALWGACALIGIVQNYIFAELSAMFPNKPGGIALYAHEAWKKYCEPLGAVAAWGYWMGWSLGLAVFGLLIGSLVQSQWFPHATWTFWDGAVHVGLPQLVAAATIIAVWLLNVFGIKPAVKTNYVLGGLLIVVFAVFMFLPFVTGDFHSSGLTWKLGDAGQSWGGAKLALVWLFVMGWSGYATEICATFAPEYREVRRDTVIALRVSAIFALVVFVLLPIGAAGTVGEKVVTANPVGFYAPVFAQLIGNASGFVIFVLCAALFLSMNSNTADASRAIYGIAKDRMIIRQLDHLNKHHVPGRAMTVDLVVNLALVFFVGNTLGVLFASNVGYFVCIIVALTGFLLLRKDRPNANRPIRLRRIWLPIAGFLSIANLVILIVGVLNPGLAGYGGFTDTMIGVGLLSLSIPLWLLRAWQDGVRVRLRAPDSSPEADLETAAVGLES